MKAEEGQKRIKRKIRIDDAIRRYRKRSRALKPPRTKWVSSNELTFNPQSHE